MFIREKPNKSGKISVQIIDKSNGKYHVLQTIGCTSNRSELENLKQEAKQWVIERKKQTQIDYEDEKLQAEQYLKSIKQINVKGTELLLCKIYYEIGFGVLSEELFKQLVFSRLCFPASKLRTTEYLYEYHSIEINVDKIYRYLDKLNNQLKERVQKISYEHTLKILGNIINIIFYDVTTLYFEIDEEDELRKTGFSKEGKHQNPQVILGLLVSIDGYPLSYEIFEGNKFEGHTMLPVIEDFKSSYKLDKLVIIADSGLLSRKNISQLQSRGYEYILGARIKNESGAIKQEIQKLALVNGGSAIIEKDKQTKIIISYSLSRAKKDRMNREKGLRRLEKQIKSGNLTKSNINKRGYNKYLNLEGVAKVSINRQAYEEDEKWDGLKGYITNTNLTKEAIIENYGHLWKIEKAFRISKTDLKIRPIFHRLRRRIESHICISFTAYKVYKELERQLRIKGLSFSPEKAIQIAKTIYSIRLVTPLNKDIIEKLVIVNKEQELLVEKFDL